MQEVSTPGNLLSGVDGHTVGEIRLTHMAVLHLKLAILGDDIVLVDGIRSDAHHRTCRQSKQWQVVGSKVHTTMVKTLACHGMRLLTKAQAHLYLFLLTRLERHHESACGLQ